MSITPEQIAHVLELDSKRTQGEWWQIPADQTFAVYEDGFVGEALGVIYTDADRNFIVHAPLMAQIIRHQQEQLRVAREALEEVQHIAALEEDETLHTVVTKALSLIDN